MESNFYAAQIQNTLARHKSNDFQVLGDKAIDKPIHIYTEIIQKKIETEAYLVPYFSSSTTKQQVILALGIKNALQVLVIITYAIGNTHYTHTTIQQYIYLLFD